MSYDLYLRFSQFNSYTAVFSINRARWFLDYLHTFVHSDKISILRKWTIKLHSFKDTQHRHHFQYIGPANRGHPQLLEQRARQRLFYSLKHIQETSPVAKALTRRRREKKRNHVKTTTTVTNANNKMLFVTLHGFLIIFHVLRKSFHLKLQPAGVMLEAKL